MQSKVKTSQFKERNPTVPITSKRLATAERKRSLSTGKKPQAETDPGWAAICLDQLGLEERNGGEREERGTGNSCTYRFKSGQRK